MSIEQQNYDRLTVNHSDGSEPRREVPIKDTEVPDCWHVAMATEKGLGRETILTCWHLAHDFRDKLLKLAEPRAIGTDERFIVEEYTVCDGWTNNWTDDDNPADYDTAEAAQAAIDDFFDDLTHAAMSQDYSRDDYRIVKIEREVVK